MKEDYEERMDKIFGSSWRHRTLRTIFDPYSSEWDKTSYDNKLEIIKKIIDSGEEVQYLIEDYKERYEEQNRKDIARSVEFALLNLLTYKLKKENQSENEIKNA